MSTMQQWELSVGDDVTRVLIGGGGGGGGGVMVLGYVRFH